MPTPTSSDACSLADWAEALTFAEDRTSSSRSFLRGRLRSCLNDVGDELEIQLDLLLSEVDRRKRIAGDTYPFALTDIGLSRTWDVEASPYEFLLWLAISEIYRQENRYTEIDTLFDDLVTHALIIYLGHNAVGVRFGFPASQGRPADFPGAVKWLAASLRLPTGAANPRSHLKDGGVDVVVWSPFGDKRAGFIVVLGQCTVAKDWTPKAKDIQTGQWNGWIDFGLEPLKALAIPFAIPQGFDRWDDLRRTVNVILDRMRLVELIEIDAIDNLAAIQTWNSRERSLLSPLT